MPPPAPATEKPQPVRLPTAYIWVLTVAALTYAVAYTTGYRSGRRRGTADLAPYKAQAETLGKEREQLIGRLARQQEQLARLAHAKPAKRR